MAKEKGVIFCSISEAIREHPELVKKYFASVVPNSDISTTTGDDLGSLSFGRLNNITRGSNPISITVTGLTVDSNLSTFPTIQRAGGDYTLRNTGALPKSV